MRSLRPVVLPRLQVSRPTPTPWLKKDFATGRSTYREPSGTRQDQLLMRLGRSSPTTYYSTPQWDAREGRYFTPQLGGGRGDATSWFEQRRR